MISKDRSINIFAGLTRDVDTVSSRLESGGINTTVLAPLNSVMSALPRKPWEDPEDYEKLGTQAYEGLSGSDRAQQNMKRFVEAHVVLQSPWEEGQKAKTMGGSELWWEKKDGVKMIQPGDIEVDNVSDKVANGEVWLIKGVVNYAK